MARRATMLYVGGLDDNVSEEILHAAFIPFGELKSVQVPKDFQQNKARGFGFVEYDLEEDAKDAIENMDGAELFGKVLRVNVARKMPNTAPGKAIWNAEEWIQNSLKDQDGANEPDEEIEPDNLQPEASLNTIA